MVSTAAQAKAYGYVVPNGTDPIRDGDNAINNNARVCTGNHTFLLNGLMTQTARIDALETTGPGEPGEPGNTVIRESATPGLYYIEGTPA